MKKKILTTSLALALGLTLIAPTTEAKADELDDLLNGATEIEEDLNQNTGDLDKLDKEKVVIPAAKIEDIAKPNKKEEKPNPDKPSNEDKKPDESKPEEKPSDKENEEKPSEDKKKPSAPSKEDKKEDSKNKSNKDEKVDENKKEEEKTSKGKDINLIKPSKAKENKTDDGKGKAPQTQNKNVQTGIESLNLVATTLIASIGSYLHIKKNK